MYRVIKVLNNNGVLAFDMDKSREVIFLGNGAGFGKKTGERFAQIKGASSYAAEPRGDAGSALKAVNGMDPVFLEVTGKIIDEAEKRFQNVNRDVLLPLADHIALAVQRAREGKEFPNPFNQDIRAMFPQEYLAAEQGKQMIEEATGQRLSEDETGLITLHIHAALSDENVEESLMAARLVKVSVEMIEEGLHVKLKPDSLSYNRLVSHVRYMIFRIMREEQVSLDLEDYAKESFPLSYSLAEQICTRLERELKKKIRREEIGFLGIHIERVARM